jgi:hypothetical protein
MKSRMNIEVISDGIGLVELLVALENSINALWH